MEIRNGEQLELERTAAESIKKQVEVVLEEKDKVIFGIVGGRSVKGVFEQLNDQSIPWEKVHIFMVDERLLPKDDLDTNIQVAKEALLTKLVEDGQLPKENVHEVDYTQGQEQESVDAYLKEFQVFGGQYDIVLLSSGEDGHVGSLFPNSEGIKEEKETFVLVENAPKPPATRMSASKGLIRKANMGIILFFGDGKKDAFEKFKDENVSVIACPVKLSRGIENLYVLGTS